MDPGSTEDDVAKDLDFQMSLELYKNDILSVGHSTETLRWYNLSISIVNLGSRKADEYLPKTIHLRSPPSNPERQLLETNTQSTPVKRTAENLYKRSRSLSGHVVRSITNKGKSVNALIQGSLDLIIEPKQKTVGCLKTSTPSAIVGICQLIRKHEKYPATDNGRIFYGNIMDREDPERRFGLYAPTPLKGQPQAQLPPLSCRPLGDLPSTLTLRQLLDQSSDRVQLGSSIPLLFLEFQDKLQLAVVVAVNILHLYSSPWLPSIITVDDILFRLEDDATSTPSALFSPKFRPGFPYRPFIKKPMPPSASATMPTAFGAMPESRKRETTVFSFGLLLIQIMLGRVINELDLKLTSNGQSATTSAAGQSINNTVVAMTVDDYMGKRELGKGFEGAVLTEAGPEFVSAVTRCLDSFVNIEGLQSEKFCQEFYVEVISMLQDALEKAMEL